MKLLDNVISAPVSGDVKTFGRAPARLSIALYGTSGAVSAAGNVEFSDDQYFKEKDSTPWSLTGTGVGTTRSVSAPAAVATLGIDYPWAFWRITVASISGTGAAVDANING